MENTLNKANKILGTNYKDWRTLSRHNGLTKDFIREFADSVHWDCISIYQHLSEDFIREFKDDVDWFWISECQHLSENFIREFKDKVDWYCISRYQHIFEDFIREFEDKVYWEYISGCQHLSETFIREFKDRICWYNISTYQQLSEAFIREFKDRVDWIWIAKYQRLSKNFIRKFKNDIYKKLIADSWHYKSVEEKKKAVMETGLYECHDDYFIAYKGIRTDRYSNFNFQYQYLKGHTYETWCDCSANENGFGFSAWTETKAREYCDELLVRVKVRYEDVGRVVHKGGKIRCFKLEVLD